MSLHTGTRLGPYEILGPLGAGGMGEVYRARDDRIGREVAVKVLPADVARDSERLRRFEREARAAGSLNHPNLLTLFDVGTHEDAPYLVTELLEGATLRTLLAGTGLPRRKALDYGMEIARGLAAAHEKGIIHRDLKPENLFVTRSGQVKVLDFGLAKLVRRDGDQAHSDVATATSPTEAGVLLGTVGYMSPEQARGEPADERSDIFALGAVLYEMLSGRRAFKGATSVETLNAILKEDPPEISGTGQPLAPAVDRIVRRCLDKDPAQRFRSAHDVAFALEAVSGSFTEGPSRVPSARRRFVVPAVLTVGVAGIAGLAFVAGRARGTSEPPRFHQLTFRRGIVGPARFSADASTIVYGARWEADPHRVFQTRVESPASQPLLAREAGLLAVSPTGELALGLDRPRLGLGPGILATLATVPLAGGEPREVSRDVQSADWGRDGASLAVVRRVAGQYRLEYPIGRILYETPTDLMNVRVSPNGQRIALREGNSSASIQTIAVLDREGRTTVRSAALGGGEGMGLAWSPRGDEVWFARHQTVVALDLRGHERVVTRLPASVHVQDIARDGRVLLVTAQLRQGIAGRGPGEDRERDLSWLVYSILADLSRDGKQILFADEGLAGEAAAYVRQTDASSGAVRLGEGWPLAFSPDGRSALVAPTAGGLALLPLGVGEPRTFDTGELRCNWAAFRPPEGREVLLDCGKANEPVRQYRMDLGKGTLRPRPPEVGDCGVFSPDGRQVICLDTEGRNWLYPLDGGEPRTLVGLDGEAGPIQWSADGRSLFVLGPPDLPRKISRWSLASGRKELWKELMPADPAGIYAFRPYVAPDGRAYVYRYERFLSDLWVVNGLR